MANNFHILKGLIKQEIQVPITKNDYGKPVLRLEDYANQENHKKYSIIISGIPEVGISKQPTRPSLISKTDKHDSPEKMLKMASSNRLVFNHLV